MQQIEHLNIETTPLFSMREMDGFERDIRSDERRKCQQQHAEHMREHARHNANWRIRFWRLLVCSVIITVYAFALYVANGEMQSQPVVVELGK